MVSSAVVLLLHELAETYLHLGFLAVWDAKEPGAVLVVGLLGVSDQVDRVQLICRLAS